MAPPSRRLTAVVRTVVVLGLLLPPGGTAARADEDAAAVHPAIHASLEPLRPWLTHGDWTLRSIAAHELRRRGEPGVVLLATRLLAVERHPYPAACALDALRGRPRRELVMEGGAALVDALLRWANDAHPTVRSHALEVLRRMPTVRLGDDRARYEGWWKRGREALVREQEALQASARAEAKRTAPHGGGATSVAPARDDRFYARLELMRKNGLELCIAMDHTGSMGGVIRAAKRQAVALLRRLRAYLPKFRAGLVTYDDQARQRIMLTANGKELEKAFDRVAAAGGGDYEEGVDKALRLALREGGLGWSYAAYRVIVVVGDAPPHDADLPGLLRFLQRARSDAMYEEPIVVHTVSTSALPVLHFPKIAQAGGGQHVTLSDTGALLDELVLLAFGGSDRARIREWMKAIDALGAAAEGGGTER